MGGGANNTPTHPIPLLSRALIKVHDLQNKGRRMYFRPELVIYLSATK